VIAVRPSDGGSNLRKGVRTRAGSEIAPVQAVPLTPSSQGTGPLPLDLAPDPVELRFTVVQPKILVETAQHHRQLPLLILPFPMHIP
jgi:hypothetical protein